MLLEHQAAIGARTPHFAPGQAYRSGIIDVQTGDDAQQGTFAGATRADDCEHLALGHRERPVAQGLGDGACP